MSVQGHGVIPDTMFYLRVRDPSIGGPNPFRWQPKPARELLAGKRVLIFGLPGAFTPTCTTEQCPDFEHLYDDIRKTGIDEVYCTSVNDAFVMYQWSLKLGIEKVKMLPDGNGDFARGLGMLVDKSNLGFGPRSWRYAMIVDDLNIVMSLVEDGKMDNCPTDPYSISTAQNVLAHLK